MWSVCFLLMFIYASDMLGHTIFPFTKSDYFLCVSWVWLFQITLPDGYMNHCLCAGQAETCRNSQHVCMCDCHTERQKETEYEGMMQSIQWCASVHVLEKYNEICRELLQRGALNDNLCPPSSNAFQRGNQRAPLARALGAGGNSLLVRSHQRDPRRRQKDTNCVHVLGLDPLTEQWGCALLDLRTWLNLSLCLLITWVIGTKRVVHPIAPH